MSLIPATCSAEQVSQLPEDNFESGSFYIMRDTDTIILSEHRRGDKEQQRIEIPRKQFNKLVEWYTGAALKGSR